MTQSDRQTLGLILLLAFLAAIGPLSDRFGRRPILLVGFGLYFLATIACALAQDAHTLIIARGLQGLAAAASPAAGRAMVRDLWAGDRAARAMSYITMAVIIAPLIAPTLGGYILVHSGWRTIFWMLLVFAATALALVLWRLPETNGPEKRGNIFLLDYFRAYARVLRNQQSWAYLFCGGLPYAAMFAYITASPFVYIELFGVSPEHFGLYFGLNVAGLFIGTWINSLLVVRFGSHRLLAGGVTISLIGSLLLVGSSYFDIGGLTAIVIGLFITVAPASMIGANSTVGLLNLYPHNAGAAAALFGVAQFGLGAVASLLVGLLYTGTPMAMALAMTVACSGSFLALFWLNRCRRLHPHADILP